MYFPALAKHNCEAIKCRACDSSSYKSATTKIAVWNSCLKSLKKGAPISTNVITHFLYTKAMYVVALISLMSSR